MEKVVYKYLKMLTVPVSKKYWAKLLRSHPNYPSLLSITDTLRKLSIPYYIAQINKEDLNEISYPFLFLSLNDNDQIRIISKESDVERLSIESLNQGIALQIEPIKEVDDARNKQSFFEETFLRRTIFALLAAITGISILSLFNFFFWSYFGLLLCSICGAGIGYLLIAKELGITYEPVETLCHSGKTADCNSVLHSRGARIFKVFKLTDLTVSYFIFQTVILLLASFASASLTLLSTLSVLSIASIPIIIYSLYYQYKKVQRWCRLCLAVDLVLLIELAIFGAMYTSGFLALTDANVMTALISLCLFVIIKGVVSIFRKKIEERNYLREQEIKTNRIKYSADVFTCLLEQEKRGDISFFENELLIGKADAPINLMMAGSLTCGPCKRGFEKAKKMIEIYPEKINLAIRLVNTGDDRRYFLAHWLQHICDSDDISRRTKKLFEDWYSVMDLPDFKQQYETEIKNELEIDVKSITNSQDRWLEQAEIKGTPTFFINGYEKPHEYSLEDIMMLLPDLALSCQKGKNHMLSSLVNRDNPS